MYFKKAGAKNTQKTLRLALQRAKELKIKDIVVASTYGSTARILAQMAIKGLNVVCVTHHAGFEKPGKLELTAKTKEFLESKGIKVYRATHYFSGVGRAIRLQFGGLYPGEIVANTYRTLGEGMKVAVEISIMALDAGLIPYGKEIIAIGGTSRGADTAIVLKPAHGRNFFATEILEIICKPRRPK
uniref:Pyruvate kinase C-terminal domain-containing protein n=1 Tax=candidate division WOR-3 bacterium TaxID=2052148 RepID=A0A7C6EE74_UNCW3